MALILDMSGIKRGGKKRSIERIGLSCRTIYLRYAVVHVGND
jgi:hypothetical protein